LKNIKILFVYPNFGTPFSFHTGIRILSAVLKRNGVSTALLHLHEEHGIPNKTETIISQVKEYAPDLIGFTATTFEYKVANKIAGDLKKAFPEIPIIIGGIHATIKPDDLESSNFDGFCVGEGENALVELVNRMAGGKDYTRTGSFWFKTSSGIVSNPMLPVVENLDELPYYDMEIMDTKKLLQKRNHWLNIGFSRGCPYNCSFCINSLLKKITYPDGNLKNYLRKNSVDRTIEELEDIISKYGKYIEVFNFDDDLLMLYKDWMIEFSQKYKERIYEKYGVTYAINARVETMDKDVIEAMSKSGCREIRIGFETGSYELRKNILNKAITDEQLINAFLLCDRYGIKTNAFAMLGIPGETKESINTTFSLLSKLKPYLIRLTFLHPIIYTEIYDYCEKHALFKSGSSMTDQFTESPLKLENISDEDLLRYRILFPWYLNTYLSAEAAKYSRLIEQFADMSYSKLSNQETLQEIIKVDNGISAELESKHIPHYRYFQNNLYYFQLKGK
jgi:radical SAM superfamily enzyme YgiQ (UPF0313 family)